MKWEFDGTGPYKDVIKFADSSVLAYRREIGAKGMPMAFLKDDGKQKRINGLPLPWLLDHGCSCEYGEKSIFVTTAGTRLEVKKLDDHYGPYLDAQQIELVFRDLPDAETLSCKIVPSDCTASAARVAVPCPRAGAIRTFASLRDTQDIPHRSQDSQQAPGPPRQGCLCGSRDAGGSKKGGDHRKHLRQELRSQNFDNADCEKILRKYDAMPDVYYEGTGTTPVGPMLFGNRLQMESLGFRPGESTQLWEWMAGSATLSAMARTRQISHLPPIDHRWGWHIGNADIQEKLLYAQLIYGTDVLFAAPTCTPRGGHS